MAHLFAAGLRFDFLRQSVLKLERLPCTKMSEVNAARQMKTRTNLHKRQSSACRVWILTRSPEKNSLFCLVSKQATHRARIVQHARDRHIYRAARETPATGDLNTLADFTYDPKATDTTADRIGRYFFRVLVVIR
jgi:hypothetical protein